MKKFFKVSKGFTIPELLVAMTILSLLLLMLASMIDQVQSAFSYAESKVSQFREARVAFDQITKSLSQATVNGYWDYEMEKVKQKEVPKSYVRRSDMQFKVVNAQSLVGTGAAGCGHAVLFQAPLGFSNKYENMKSLLNGRGYFVYFGDDSLFKPSIVDTPPRYRYRVMEYRPPSENNMIFSDSIEERAQGKDLVVDWWYTDKISPTSGTSYSYPLAENVICLAFSPRDSLSLDQANSYSLVAPSYEYDSTKHAQKKFEHQVPPLVKVTLVAIDETSAIRVENGATKPVLLPAGIFTIAANYENDIETLRTTLSGAGVKFKVFSTLVAMRSSKWSEFSGTN